MKDNTIVIRQNTRDVTVDFLANLKKINPTKPKLRLIFGLAKCYRKQQFAASYGYFLAEMQLQH